ncbi:helix-turn-helix domain-containing protein [Candidatus Woesearchaeota archaeon]|nr:helix-turn-helix domain-containing protein [Candidatus Woesearchaeota archaeon]
MENIDNKQKYKLKRFINQLKSIRGRHTELVSVYIPKDYNIFKVIQQLTQEKDTASNIKDKRTRTNVQDSLERLMRHLRLYKETPTNGLAGFAGNISDNESKVDIEVFSIEPPLPITTRLYRCDQTFVLDELEKQLESNSTHGLVVMDKREATIGLLKGSYIEKLHNLTSGVPGKYKTGGQCLLPDSLVQSFDGTIPKIEMISNPHIVKSIKLKNKKIEDSNVIDSWNSRKNKIFRIITKNPRLELSSSKDHLFFVYTNEGIIEKPAEKLKVGDKLLTPEKIEIKGELQKLKSKKYYNSFTINKEGQNLLKQKRLEKRLLQRELAKKTNLFQTTVSYYEIGRQRAHRTSLYHICKALDINFDEFLDKYCEPHSFKGKSLKLPLILDEKLAQFLGYFLGDGNSEKDRVTLSEQNKQVALFYKDLYEKYFVKDISYKFRESKNYHQLRITSRPLVRLMIYEFPELKKTLDSEIPEKILKSPENIVSAFLRGLFDAEGYVHQYRGIGFSVNNKRLAQQILMILPRFSIVSSIHEYDNNKNRYSNNQRFTIDISEKKSLELFKQHIGFNSRNKAEKLDNLLLQKSDTSYVRQILTSGVEIRKLIEKTGYNLALFPKINNFFRNERMMSKEIFKNSLMSNIKDKNLYYELQKIYDCPILPVQINKIEITKKAVDMIDISVKNQNFIANGIIVHNSAARFGRLREQAAKEFYIRIAEVVNKEFLNRPEVKGIIIGGPGPTKNEFFDGAFINNEVKKKVVGLKDITYTDEFGLEELVDKSKDLLAEEEVTAEKEILHKFLSMLATDQKRTAYGLKDVEKALDYGAVETLIILEGKIDDKTAEELEEKAVNMGARTEIVTEETQEGKQFKNLGGVGAILRFPIN